MHHTFSNMILTLRKDFKEYCFGQLQEIGLSQGLLYFILYIGKHPGCSPGQLCARLKFDTGHGARSIEKLVQTDFIKKERDAGDKRAYCLSLTEKGDQAFQLIYELFCHWDQEALKNLNEQEKAELLRLMTKIEKTSGGKTYDTYDD